MWLKYSDEPILVGEQYDMPQPTRLSQHQKPCGFWITDESEDCWRSWCVNQPFALERLTHKHEVVLDEADILFLRSVYEIHMFTRQFGVAQWWGPAAEPNKYRDWCIDWPAVAARYSGIIITPYQWSCRLGAGTDWYYGWDCASGCIWRASAIRDIRLIEIDHAVVNTKPRWQDDDAEAA